MFYFEFKWLSSRLVFQVKICLQSSGGGMVVEEEFTILFQQPCSHSTEEKGYSVEEAIFQYILFFRRDDFLILKGVNPIVNVKIHIPGRRAL